MHGSGKRELAHSVVKLGLDGDVLNVDVEATGRGDGRRVKANV